MVTTKKEKTIEAFKELIDRYDNPFKADGYLKEFQGIKSCPLCTIHLKNLYTSTTPSCNGCPLMSNSDLSFGCVEFESHQKVRKIISQYLARDGNLTNKEDVIKACKERALFFKRRLSIIKKADSSMFLSNTKKYFNFKKSK
jgi:hypothetical protein